MRAFEVSTRFHRRYWDRRAPSRYARKRARLPLHAGRPAQCESAGNACTAGSPSVRHPPGRGRKALVRAAASLKGTMACNKFLSSVRHTQTRRPRNDRGSRPRASADRGLRLLYRAWDVEVRSLTLSCIRQITELPQNWLSDSSAQTERKDSRRCSPHGRTRCSFLSTGLDEGCAVRIRLRSGSWVRLVSCRYS